MRRLWLAFGILALAVASACGGGNGGDDDAAPTVTADDLRNIVTLSSEGLGLQLVLQSHVATTNPQSAAAFPDPQKWASNYQNWGRIGGHEASYGFAGEEGLAAQTQAEVYETVGGAEAALSALREFMTSGEALTAYANMGYTDAKIDVVEAPEMGDESSAYRLTASASGTRFDTLVILFRRGPVLAQASVGAAPDASDLADVQAVAQQMDTRIEEILSR